MVSMYDDPNPNTRTVRQKPVKTNADPEAVAALARQLGRLKRMEESDKTYQEMCRSADERVMGR